MIINWFKQRIFGTVYVKVRKNRFSLRHIENKRDIELSANSSFSTNRLLIGEFEIAEKLLKDGIKKFYKTKSINPSPRILMHPLEMLEDGLSQVEARVLREVAYGAGGSWVALWQGHELSDIEVLNEIKRSKNIV